jgi:hypothetical protein
MVVFAAIKAMESMHAIVLEIGRVKTAKILIVIRYFHVLMVELACKHLCNLISYAVALKGFMAPSANTLTRVLITATKVLVYMGPRASEKEAILNVNVIQDLLVKHVNVLTIAIVAMFLA